MADFLQGQKKARECYGNIKFGLDYLLLLFILFISTSGSAALCVSTVCTMVLQQSSQAANTNRKTINTYAA